jgi:short-subunit dehydrogenase
MSVSLRPLDQRVVVITGASSGIGLTTAQAAAERGAKLVLTSRSESMLGEIVRAINEEGGEAISVIADISDRRQIDGVAAAASDPQGTLYKAGAEGRTRGTGGRIASD